MRLSDYIASEILSVHNVRKVFGVTGAGIMHLTDSFYTKSGAAVPEFVAVHHEESATMAADAYARKTGGIGVALVSTGPGATNAITGVAGAFQDSVPMLVIAGQVKRSEALGLTGKSTSRQGGVQELDTLPLVSSITKAAVRLDDAEQIETTLRQLIEIAKSGRPGPVWLEIPLDVQAKKIKPRSLELSESKVDSDIKNEDAVQQALGLISKSQKPLFLVGRGVELSKAEDSLTRFIQTTRIPAVSTYLGMASASKLGANYIGTVGIKGSRAANILMQECDLLITVGSSMHVSVTGYDYSAFSPRSIKIDINIEKVDGFKKNYKPNLTLVMDCSRFLDLAFELCEPDKVRFDEWLHKATSLEAILPRGGETYPQSRESMSIYEVVNTVSTVLSSQDTVISDAGSAYYCTSQNIKLVEGSTYITSGAMATMGFSLPAAIGAAFGLGRVFALTGDGSFQQSLQELTLLQTHQLPVCLIVLDNSGYLSIRNSQKNYFENRFLGTDSGSGLDFPNLELLAQSYGIEYEFAQEKIQLEKSLNGFDKSPKIIHVQCHQSEPITPNVASRMGDDGKMISDTLEFMSPSLDKDKLVQVKNLGFLK